MRLAQFTVLLLVLSVPGWVCAEEVDLYDEEAVQDILGRPITDVAFVPEMPDVSDGLDFFGLEKYQPVTHELVWEMLIKMWLTGKVGQVGVYAEEMVDGTVILKVEYEYRQRIEDVIIKGNKKLDKKKILGLVGYRPDMEIFPDTLDQMEANLQKEYALRGYPDASFLLEIDEGDEPGEATLKITVIEGVPYRIREVLIEYTEGEDPLEGPVPVIELMNALGLSGGDVYDQIKLKKGVSAMEEDLRDAGYLNVQVGPVEPVTDEAGKTTLRIPVYTGPEVRFVILGNDHVPDHVVLEVMEHRRVLPLNAGIVEEMAQRIMDHYRSLGFLEASVLVQQKDFWEENLLVYRFQVTEGARLQVSTIDFFGNEQFSDKFLRKQVVSFLYEEVPYDAVFSGVSFEVVNSVLQAGGKGDIEPPKQITEPLATWPPEWIFWSEAYEKAIEHIEKLYISEGYLNVTVSPPALTRQDDKLTVTLSIKEGTRTYVATVHFQGNEALTDEELAKQTGIEEGNPFSGLGVKDAEAAILDAYGEKGHRFATVKTEVDFSQDATSADVRYVIVEGPQVVVDRILVRGNALTATSLIKDRIDFEPGDVFTLKKERRSLNRLHKLDIFRSVTIEMLEPSIPDEKKTIIIEVVERKPQYLALKGGASTAEGVRGSMEYAYRNLFGYAVDFHFRVALNFRLFFVGVTEEFRDWYLNMNLLDQLERNISVGLTLPHVPVIGNWFTFETSFAHVRRNANVYGITSNSLTGSILTGSGKRFNLTIQSSLQSSSINANTEITEDLLSLPLCGEVGSNVGECINPIDRQTLRVPQTDDPATFVVTGTRINLDFRDNPFNPTKGFSLNGSLNWIISTRPVDFTWFDTVEVGGVKIPRDPYRTDDYLKNTHHETAYTNALKLYLDMTGYISLGTPKVVLMLHAGGGIMVDLPRHTHTFPDRFFYLGGARSLRGVPEEGLCAQDEYDAYLDAKKGSDPEGQNRAAVCFQGGELMVMYKVELRTMLRGSFGLAFFLDAGNLWHGWDDRYGTDGVDGWYKIFYDLRFTAGAGIRYITPVGPINLDVGFLLNRRDVLDEPIGAFHFSIGTF